jgi:hypothetical protein
MNPGAYPERVRSQRTKLALYFPFWKVANSLGLKAIPSIFRVLRKVGGKIGGDLDLACLCGSR